MNKDETCGNSDPKLTQGGSPSVRYELIDKDGRKVAWFETLGGATDFMANCALELDLQVIDADIVQQRADRGPVKVTD